MLCHQIVSDIKLIPIYLHTLSLKPIKNLNRNVAFFATCFAIYLSILFEIKLNIMKSEKYLKSIFLIDKKLHDANLLDFLAKHGQLIYNFE